MENKKYKPGIGFILIELFWCIGIPIWIEEEGIFMAVFTFIVMTVISFAFSYSSWKKKMKIEAMTPEEREACIAQKKSSQRS